MKRKFENIENLSQKKRKTYNIIPEIIDIIISFAFGENLYLTQDVYNQLSDITQAHQIFKKIIEKRTKKIFFLIKSLVSKIDISNSPPLMIKKYVMYHKLNCANPSFIDNSIYKRASTFEIDFYNVDEISFADIDDLEKLKKLFKSIKLNNIKRVNFEKFSFIESMFFLNTTYENNEINKTMINNNRKIFSEIIKTFEYKYGCKLDKIGVCSSKDYKYSNFLLDVFSGIKLGLCHFDEKRMINK